MAILSGIPTKLQLLETLEIQRAEMKAVPEELRPESKELAQVKATEIQLNKRQYSANGETVPQAYFKVTHVHFSKGNCHAFVDIFASEEARQTGEPSLTGYSEELAPPTEPILDPIAWAYDCLKTLPMFAEAVDA